MDNDFSLMRYLIGASRIKFDQLDNLFCGIDRTKYTNCTMVIDAHSIVYRILRERNVADVHAIDTDIIVRDITVGVLNVIGHYRRYIATRLGLDNTIIVTFTRTPPTHNRGLINDYYTKPLQKYSNPTYSVLCDAINTAYDFMCSLSPYFEDVYIVKDTGIDDTVFAQAFTPNVNLEKSLRILFTKNMHWCQLLDNRTKLLTNARDKSVLLDSNNYIEDGILAGQVKRKSSYIPPTMLPLAFSLGGCGDVGVSKIPGIGGMAKALSVVSNMLKDGVIGTGATMSSLLDNIATYVRADIDLNADELNRRYMGLSTQIGISAVTSTQGMNILSQCYNIYDGNALEDINDILASGAIDPNIIELTNLSLCKGATLKYPQYQYYKLLPKEKR